MLAFSHIYKSGGTSLKWILRNSFGINHLEVERWDERYYSGLSYVKNNPIPFKSKDLKKVKKFFPHVKSIQSHEIVPYENLESIVPDIRYFTFVRDPLKQTASWFQYLVNIGKRTDLKFEDYIKSDFPRNFQTKMIAGTEDIELAKKIIKEKKVFIGITESFDESLVLMKKILAPELNINYIRQGTAEDNTISKELLTNNKSKQLLLDATELDRELYEYVKLELFPQYKIEYGDSFDEDLSNFYLDQKNFQYNMLKVNSCRIQSKIVLDKVIKPLYRKGIIR